MAVRSGRPDDLDALVAMIQEFALFEGDEKPEPDRAALCGHLFGDHASVECLVAELPDGMLSGFALFAPRLNPATGHMEVAYLSDLFVRDGHRGAGHGRDLMRRLAAVAADRGYSRIDWSVQHGNAPARDFYGRLGAVELVDRSTFRLQAEGIRRLAATDGAR